MKKSLLALLSVTAIIIISLYSLRIYNEVFHLESGEEYTSSFKIWAASSSLANAAQQFQEEENILVNVRQFPDHSSLIDELLTLHDGQTPPDLIEIWSHYGLGEIHDHYSILPVKNVIGTGQLNFHDSFETNFTIDGDLLAFPLGLEVPVIYLNSSLLDRHDTAELFEANDTHWDNTAALQEQIDQRSLSDRFWLLHTDNFIPWYWKAWSENHPEGQANEWWEKLYTGYELSPPLDHHMAITRFANYEIGSLLASSVRMSSIQQLVGNTFSIEIFPLFSGGSDKILTEGNGLAVLSPPDRADKDILNSFFSFLYEEDTMGQILSETGMIPADYDRINNPAFIRSLPMSQYIFELLEYKNQFTGTEPTSFDRAAWYEKLTESHEIESKN